MQTTIETMPPHSIISCMLLRGTEARVGEGKHQHADQHGDAQNALPDELNLGNVH